MNLYETLGVTSDASAATIKQAYRKAAKDAHPDAENTNPPEDTVFSYHTGGIFNF